MRMDKCLKMPVRCGKMRIGCAFLDAHVLQTGGSVKNAKKCASDTSGPVKNSHRMRIF